MTQLQKVIKYCAIAFALYLIVSIVSAVLTGIHAILIAYNLVEANSKKNIMLDEMITISDSNKEVSSIKIDVKGTNIQIKNGDEFRVETNNSKIRYTNNSGNIEVKENGGYRWIGSNKYECNLIIYLPEEIEVIDKLDLNAGAGEILIENLQVKKIEFDLGAGKVDIRNMNVTEEANVKGGVGEIKIEESEIKNLNMDLGIGKTSIKSELQGNSKIDTGIGELELNLNLPKEKYKMQFDKGIGDIKFNGQNVEDDSVQGSGENYIEINGGIGSISVNTIK